MRLEIINGQKIYGKRPILNQLNLVFQSGKIYGLKGDNGSGKTVLLKILAGYIKLDKGKVLQDGKVYGIKNHYIQDAGILIEKVEFLSHLSLGTKQKMALIQAFISSPSILFLDEPMNALDEKSVRLTKQVILSYLKKENGLVILTSHISEDISDLCTDVLVVENGHIQYSKDIQA
ncbi:ABC transporter ATP-binding protein [Streptococcus pneumoniae]|nr:ABC transporter ATP-binding protein [Streptococcus pneumoniae]